MHNDSLDIIYKIICKCIYLQGNMCLGSEWHVCCHGISIEQVVHTTLIYMSQHGSIDTMACM